MSLWTSINLWAKERAGSLPTWLESEQSSQQATSANSVHSEDEIDWKQTIRESEEFKQDPTKCLLGLIINSRPGGPCGYKWLAIASLTGTIANFFQQVTSREYLLNYAESYFAKHENRSEIIDVFEKSLSEPTFLVHLEPAKQYGIRQNEGPSFPHDHIYAADSLCIAMQIFPQSANLQAFYVHASAHLE